WPGVQVNETLRQIFSSWSFRPAHENGKVVRSQQKWLMRFHTETGLQEIESPSSLRDGAFVRVDLYPVAPDGCRNGSVLKGAELASGFKLQHRIKHTVRHRWR